MQRLQTIYCLRAAKHPPNPLTTHVIHLRLRTVIPTKHKTMPGSNAIHSLFPILLSPFRSFFSSALPFYNYSIYALSLHPSLHYYSLFMTSSTQPKNNSQ